MKRKTLIFLASVALFAGALFVLRQQITALGTRTFLKKALGTSFSCSDIRSSDGRIWIDDFACSQRELDLTARRVTFALNFGEILRHPAPFYRLYKRQVTHWSECLAAMKQYGVQLCAEEGVCHLEGKPYYFEIDPGKESYEIGVLRLLADSKLRESSFCTLQFHMKGQQLISLLQAAEVDIEQLLPLGVFAFPTYLRGYEDAKGTIQMQASVILERDGRIDEISVQFKTEDLSISLPDRELQLGLKELSAELNYPEGVEDAGLPMWKRMDCNLSLEKGWIKLSQEFGLEGLNGSLGLDPREDPSLVLTGNLKNHSDILAMTLKGKGAVHDDQAYWLDFDLNLDDRKGTLADAFLSVCSPEKESLVIELEATGLLPEQVEMLKGSFAKAVPRVNDWTVDKGTFGGKLTALFEKGELSHFEIQDLLCEQVALKRLETPFFISKISGEGRIGEQLRLSMEMPASHFFGLISDPLRGAHEEYLPDLRVALVSTLDFSNRDVKTSASAYFPDLEQVIHFGYTSEVVFPSSLEEIQSGWARSECISHELYGPILRAKSEDLRVFGNVDLVGAYDGKMIECSFQVDDFLAKHPTLDIRADQIGEKEQTVGRIRFTYALEQDFYSMEIPLKGALAYERSLGLLIENLDATLKIEDGSVLGLVEDGTLSFDGKQWLQQIEGSFQLNGQITLEDVKGALTLGTEREFILALDTWTPKTCKARFLDGKKELAHVDLSKGEDWTGRLQCKQLKESFDVALNWNLLNHHFRLDVSNEQLQFSGRKEGKDYIVDSLKAAHGSWSGLFSRGDSSFDLQHLSFQKGDLSVNAKGSFAFDFPGAESPLAVRADLELQGVQGGVSSLHFETTTPFKCACIPSRGLILSNLSLASDQSSLEIDHFESLFDQRNVVGHRLRFHFTPQFCKQLMQENRLPKALEDIQLHQGLKGQGDFSAKADHMELKASIETSVGPLKTKLEWNRGAGTISLGDLETLTFKVHRSEEGVLHFDAVKGHLGRVKANLKRAANRDLKGELSIELSLFQDVLTLPIDQYLEIWKLGGRYTFSGIFTPAETFADWAFKGKIRGSDVCFRDYTIRSFVTKAEIEEGQIVIEDLDVTDDAGKAWISEGVISRSEGQWSFSLPLVEIRSFQPGALRSERSESRLSTPLMIKSASLENVRGAVDSPKLTSAFGSLTFTNLSKQGEMSLPKNLPMTTLQNLGLEQGILVPVSGKMEYFLQDGRIYLRSIENVMSEKGRSVFVPPRTGALGYVGFDGEISLNMQVRQNVNPALTAPLEMKVRGRLGDPEITIE